MVVSSSELANIHIFTSTFNSKLSQMDRTPANVAIDINSDIIRRRTNSSSSTSSRSALIISKVSSIPYHKRMEINNDLSDKKFIDPIDSSQLSYKGNDGAGNLVRKITNTSSIGIQQYVQDKCIVLKNTSTIQEKGTLQHHANTSQLDDVINISIPYDPNQPTEPECWNRTFHSISLHSSLKYIFFDVKDIKKSLIQLEKYIENKKIDTSKSNDVAELHGIGESAWKLVSTIYNSGWDFLFADKNNNSFRQKVFFKCTPKVNSLKNSNKGKFFLTNQLALKSYLHPS